MQKDANHFRNEVSKLSKALYDRLSEGYEGVKPSAVDTAINLIDDLSSSLRTAQTYYCHETCGVTSHDDECKKMTDLSKLRLVPKGGEHGDQHSQARPWFKGQEHLEQPDQEVHEGGEGGDELLDKDTKAALISRLENWKFNSAHAIYADLSLIRRENLSDVGTKILALSEMYGNCGWFEGQMGGLVAVTVDLLIEKVRSL